MCTLGSKKGRKEMHDLRRCCRWSGARVWTRQACAQQRRGWRRGIGCMCFRKVRAAATAAWAMHARALAALSPPAGRLPLVSASLYPIHCPTSNFLMPNEGSEACIISFHCPEIVNTQCPSVIVVRPERLCSQTLPRKCHFAVFFLIAHGSLACTVAL